MAAMSAMPVHSPLGASGAYRWLVCPGSVSLSEGIYDEESEYAKQGTTAHWLADTCLKDPKLEPWALMSDFEYSTDGERVGVPGTGYTFPDGDEVFIDKNMVDAVQSYLTCLESWHPREDRNQGNHWIERKFHCPSIHKLFYGTSDFVYWAEAMRTLHVWDYKHGAGVVVEVDDNVQLKYYAAGALEDLGLWEVVEKVVIHIVQPRGWHPDGAHRYSEIDPDDLDAWVFDGLVPGMKTALISRDTIFGKHCQFCPARQGQCPSVMAAMAEYERLLKMAMKDDDKGVELMTPEQVGRLMELDKLAKPIVKAAGKRAFGLLSSGKKVPGVKLVNAKKNRGWKEGAMPAARKLFSSRCLTKPDLKSPAQIDEMPGGKEFTARWAYKPKGEVTVAVDGDPRATVNRDAKSLFTKKGKK